MAGTAFKPLSYSQRYMSGRLYYIVQFSLPGVAQPDLFFCMADDKASAIELCREDHPDAYIQDAGHIVWEGGT